MTNKPSLLYDTNKAYQNTSPECEQELEKFNVYTSYLNVLELSKTSGLIKKPGSAINAIRRLMKYPVIADDPLVYVKKLAVPDYVHSKGSNKEIILAFTKAVAHGNDMSQFVDPIKEMISGMDKLARIYKSCLNREGAKIRKNIIDREAHERLDSMPSLRSLLSKLVANHTDGIGLPDDFDWSQLELFMGVMKRYLKDIELGARQATDNDFEDTWQLVYVQPGGKYWTNDRKLTISIVQQIGLDHYLFIAPESLNT